jgi:hypothetical protein
VPRERLVCLAHRVFFAEVRSLPIGQSHVWTLT